MMWKTDGKWCCRAQLSNQQRILQFGVFLCFPPHSPPFITRKKSILPIKICVPKKITLGCAPAQGLNFWVALLQLVEKTIVKHLSVDLSMVNITSTLSIYSYELPACGEKIHNFQLTGKLLPPATLCGNVKGTRSSPRWAENASYG